MIEKCTICNEHADYKCDACGEWFCSSHLTEKDLLIYQDGSYCDSCLSIGDKKLHDIAHLEDDICILYQEWIDKCKTKKGDKK